MSRKATSVSIIFLMLTAAFVVTSMTVGKSKSHHVTGSSQKKVVRPDPPGTIDGANNPELIPDHVAYTLVFRTLATRQGTEFEKARSRAWAKSIGFDDMTADKLIEAANEFNARVSVLDQQANEIKNRTWPNPDAAVMGQLTALQAKKEALVAEIAASLPGRLGQTAAANLHQNITGSLMRKMKVWPASVNSIGKHH